LPRFHIMYFARLLPEKVDAFVAKTIVAKPELVKITRSYGKPQENNPAIPRNQYVEIRAEKPANENQASWPEYKTFKYVTEAIVTEGSDKGELRRICANLLTEGL
jgi:ParB family chromosome partitioning protein